MQRPTTRNALPAAGVAALCLALAAGCGRVDDPSLFPEYDAASAPPPPPKPATAPTAARQVLFGDLHIHTFLSADAYTMGVRATPDDAYTFARGGAIRHANGTAIQLSRPLDFAAITDHSEYIGVARESDLDVPLTRRSFRELMLESNELGITWAWLGTTIGGVVARRPELPAEQVATWRRAGWREIVEAAERHDDPGRFTALVGYEWTSMADGANLHRNIVYRSDAVPALPYSSLDAGMDPEKLWQELDRQSAAGMEAIAIAHNANLSNGRMYERVRFDGSPMDADYAALRRRREPISEIFQVKGSSETHPALSAEDGFADFELHEVTLSVTRAESQPAGSYARDALRAGLELQAERGFDPFRFGVIGSSDGHNASSPVEEGAYHGKLPMLDGTAALRMDRATLLPDGTNPGAQWSAAGLAGVWAEQNTRAAIFDALVRKETFATSGPRIAVRLFGGWAYEPALLDAPDPVAAADARGVPMGGTLPPRGRGGAPRFAVWALMDPEGARLDRIQIVKGWIDAQGASHERLFDVVASDGRGVDPKTGALPPVGNTVDVADASWTNTIGAARLEAVWADPDFDPAARAFYYARVLEIPTPRWSTYDAKTLGIEAPEPSSIQERAVTSAIWYDPPPDPPPTTPDKESAWQD